MQHDKHSEVQQLSDKHNKVQQKNEAVQGNVVASNASCRDL